MSPRVKERAKRVWRHEEPPVPHDRAAFGELSRLVRPAADEMAELHPTLAVVASAPNRFNDCSFYDWKLVRVGETTHEYDAYFPGSWADYQKNIAGSTAEARAASTVLDRLDSSEWRRVFQQAFGLPFIDEFLALVVQYELPWLVYGSSNCGEREHVFGLWTEEPTYFGECITRTDDELIDERGLVFQEAGDPDRGLSLT